MKKFPIKDISEAIKDNCMQIAVIFFNIFLYDLLISHIFLTKTMFSCKKVFRR